MLRYLKHIILFVTLILISVVCYATTYTSLSQLPNYKGVYTLPEGDRLEITGDLTIENNKTLVISAGSQFEVFGNLTIQEKGTLQLSSGSKTIIHKDLYQDGHSPLGWGLIRVDIGDIKATNSTVVVMGDYNIWHDTEYSQGSYLDDGEGNDVYIFGSSDVGGLDDKTEFETKYGTIDNLLNPVWPKCYNFKKENGDDLEVCTDAFGDIVINFNDEKYKNIGEFYIPEDLTVECRNFTITSSNQYGINSHLVSKGKIICTEEFNIKKLAEINNTTPYFETECTSSISANTMNIGYTYKIADFKGIWLTATMNITNGQGQDITFADCALVKASEISINSNISNGIVIEGHVIADAIKSTRDIYLKYNGTAAEYATLTLGSVSGYHTWENVKILAEEYTSVNLCSNPTIGDGTIENEGQWNECPKGADKIGYFKGTVLYNYGDGGWDVLNGEFDPVKEWDINPHTTDGRYIGYKTTDLIAAYASYSDCINEIPNIKFLGFDEDPFLPKDSEIEIKTPYKEINWCDDKYSKYKLQIESIWYRIINGELIYCENDNN